MWNWSKKTLWKCFPSSWLHWVHFFFLASVLFYFLNTSPSLFAIINLKTHMLKHTHFSINALPVPWFQRVRVCLFACQSLGSSGSFCSGRLPPLGSAPGRTAESAYRSAPLAKTSSHEMSSFKAEQKNPPQLCAIEENYIIRAQLQLLLVNTWEKCGII